MTDAPSTSPSLNVTLASVDLELDLSQPTLAFGVMGGRMIQVTPTKVSMVDLATGQRSEWKPDDGVEITVADVSKDGGEGVVVGLSDRHVVALRASTDGLALWRHGSSLQISPGSRAYHLPNVLLQKSRCPLRRCDRHHLCLHGLLRHLGQLHPCLGSRRQGCHVRYDHLQALLQPRSLSRPPQELKGRSTVGPLGWSGGWMRARLDRRRKRSSNGVFEGEKACVGVDGGGSHVSGERDGVGDVR